MMERQPSLTTCDGPPMSTVKTTQSGSTFVVTIDRPDVRNAINPATAASLTSAFRDYDQDANLSCAILTGAGGNFCAGFDLRSAAARTTGFERMEGGPLGPTHLLVGKPVLAAVEGYAVAGGLELALWCDLRIASETAVFGIFSRRWGVPLIDGGSVRLPRTIGHGRALDMILTGRPVNAEEASRIGLADRITPAGGALNKALELAAQIANFPQVCLRGDRMSAYEQWGLTMEEALANEQARGIEAISSGETQLGAQKFVEGAGRHGNFENTP